MFDRTSTLLMLVLAWVTPSLVMAEPQLRRPVALVADGARVFVANRRSGSISVIDRSTMQVAGETPIGRQLADMMALPDGDHLLATDEAAGELILLAKASTGVRVEQRLKVAASPVSVTLSPDGRTATVASLWAWRLTLVDVVRDSSRSQAVSLQVGHVIDLPFAPRLQCFSADGSRLFVADAFAGNLAVIDVKQARLLGVRSIEGHNIRGLALTHDGRELLIAHQMMNERVPATRDRVFWGTLMNNVLRAVKIEHLLAGMPETNSRVSGSSREGEAPAEPRPITKWSLWAPGTSGGATGDPAMILMLPDGAAAIAMAGVDEIVYWRSPTSRFDRLKVGARPIALAASPDGKQVYIANMFSDSISVLDRTEGEITREISLGSQPSLSPADRGEQLFYSARLSLDGWFSCHSCHTEGHTTGLLNDNLGDDTYDTPKRILSLLGTGATQPWAWTGSRDTLEEQVHKSIISTMHGVKPEQASDENVEAIVAFLKTLPPAPSLDRARGTFDEEGFARGQRIFERMDCARCHRPPSYTSRQPQEVSFEDETGVKRFSPPSLLGVSQRTRLLHDNRAASLREVFTKHRHADGDELSGEELRDLLAFLRGL